MIQYAHVRNTKYVSCDYIEDPPEGTIALENITKSDLHRLLAIHATQLMLRVGISIKSPLDEFNKKVGRTVSTNRMVPIVFDFQSLSPQGTKHIYSLQTKATLTCLSGKREYIIHIELSTVAESEQVKLIAGRLERA